MKKIIMLVGVLLIVGYVLFSKYNKTDTILTEDYEPKFKINELYVSKEINYRNLLNDEEKLVYEQLINAIINFDKEIILDLSHKNYTADYLYVEDVGKINNAITMDHPELIQYGYPSIYADVTNGQTRVKINYALNKNDYLKYVNIIKIELDNINQAVSSMNEYDKVKYVYEYLAKRNVYGSQSDVRAQSAYSAFANNVNPVCAGYSRASQIIFSKIGITSVIATGELMSTWLVGGAHQWNVVKVDNSYHNYDVTQSSIFKSTTGNISYIGLFSMDKSSFSLDYKDVVPYVLNNNLDYYKLNGLYYTFNANNLDKLKQILDNSKEKYVELKMNNITGFKLSFNTIKDKLGISSYSVVNDIILIKKV